MVVFIIADEYKNIKSRSPVVASIGFDSHPLEFDMFVIIYDEYYRKTGYVALHCRVCRLIDDDRTDEKTDTPRRESVIIVLREINKFHRVKMAHAHRISLHRISYTQHRRRRRITSDQRCKM